MLAIQVANWVAPPLANFQTALQTFTVGVGGTLARLDLQVQQGDAPSVPTDSLVVTLLRTSNGIPDLNQELGSVSLPAAGIPPYDNFASGEFVQFDISKLNLAVSPGDVLSFAVSYPSAAGSYFVYDSETDIYSGGTSFTYGPLDGFFGETSPRDLGFRTLVAIPEPTSLVWLVPLAIGCARRRSARASSADSR